MNIIANYQLVLYICLTLIFLFTVNMAVIDSDCPTKLSVKYSNHDLGARVAFPGIRSMPPGVSQMGF